jgi:hypothetical protein
MEWTSPEWDSISIKIERELRALPENGKYLTGWNISCETANINCRNVAGT